MKNLSLFLFLSTLLTFSVTSFADDIDDCSPFTKPHMCPSVAHIKAGGIGANVVPLNGQFYVGRRHFDYGTGDWWTFIMGPITAPNAALAHSNAVAILPTLVYMFGPVCSPVHTWACVYDTPFGVPAVASSPALPMNSLIPALKR